MHLPGAPKALTDGEIRELIMQTAIHCGGPGANSAVRACAWAAGYLSERVNQRRWRRRGSRPRCREQC